MATLPEVAPQVLPDVSPARLFAAAQMESCAFIAAVHQLYGRELARVAGELWIDELDRVRWNSEDSKFRTVSIAASARIADLVSRQGLGLGVPVEVQKC